MNFIVLHLECLKGYIRLAASMDYRYFVKAKDMDYYMVAYTGFMMGNKRKG